MRFTWDRTKAAANRAKHQVSFEEAATVFDDPYASIDHDRQHPDRLNVIGYSNRQRILFVVAIDLDGDTIRIISARRATAAERAEYES